MDAVIAYVNGEDHNWLNEISKYTNDIHKRRYRDFGWLKYLLRGIEKYIPWINNVFIIVSSESQIPDWANRDKIHFVLHRDYIPKELLPTFNSTTIELFMPLIDGLGEEFLYFNDDVYVIDNVKYEDCFIDGKSIIRICDIMQPKTYDQHLYWNHIKNSIQLVNGIYNRVPQVALTHTFTPMNKSVCLDLLYKAYDKIYSSCSMFRQDNNINQYVYPYYAYSIDKAILTRENNAGYCIVNDIISFIRQLSQRDKSILCINDINDEVSDNQIDFITNQFKRIFPSVSKYERK